MTTGWTDDDVPALADQRFLITGANTGLGLETARVMLRRGAEVVLLCRDRSRGERALAELRDKERNGKSSLELLDLGSLASVRGFAEREIASKAPISALVCNAGLMAIPESKTADGFETQIGVNHLGHFALVGLLMEKLSASRVVVVSSGYHKKGKLALFDDLSFEKRRYQRWTAYCQSKLANLLFMFELARRCERHKLATIAVGAHPGYTATELQSRGVQLGSPKWEGWGMALGNVLVAQPVRAGAWPQLRAATDPHARPGDYFGPSGLLELRGPAVHVWATRAARDEAAARALWAKSEELTKVRFLD
jgi:NAD(P)-dependent dehydrogenase (short-subunit alcohol dehydrogenase family)